MSMPMPPGYSNRESVPKEKPSEEKLSTSIEGVAFNDDEINFILAKHLSLEQRRDIKLVKFIMAYVDCRHVGQAADQAGLERAVAYNIRKKPWAAACIDAFTSKAMMKYGYDAADVVERVKEIVDIDPIEFENPDGSYKTHMSQIKPEVRRAVKKFKAKNIYGEDPNGMKTVIGQLIEVELWSKEKAVELLGREKGVFKETRVVEHGVTEDMRSILLESKRRGEERLVGPERPLLVEARDVGGSGGDETS